jgi:hypothetical protein
MFGMVLMAEPICCPPSADVEPATTTAAPVEPATTVAAPVEPATTKAAPLPTTTAAVAVNAAMCSFCAVGIPDPSLVLPTNDGTTCGVAQGYALSLAASDVMCSTVLMAEPICCPTPATTAAPDINAATTAALADTADAIVPEPRMSIPATVTTDPAVSMPANEGSMDTALFGGKTGKSAKAKSLKKTTKSGKALPVVDAKAEKVKSAKSTKATKVAKTMSHSMRRI